MPILENALHERVAQEVVADPRNETASGIRAGLSKKTASQSVSRILKRKEVRARIVELQTGTALQAVLTANDIVNELEVARQVALTGKTKQPGAAVQATMGKAKVLGLIVDKSLALVKPFHLWTKEDCQQFLAANGKPMIAGPAPTK